MTAESVSGKARRLDRDHVLLKNGFIYCSEQGDSMAPVLRHSTVTCGFCGREVHTMHKPSKNPSNNEWAEPQQKAVSDWKGGSFTYPYISSSNNDDAYVITLWSLHHTGKIPTLHKTRGYDWKVYIPSHGDFVVQVKNRKDFKAGIIEKNPMPSYAMLLRAALAKGHPADVAREIAARNLEQAAVFLREPRREKNPPSKNGPTKIYGKTERIFMTKTSGPYKGQRFVHAFKPGVEQIGFPRGTIVHFPDGKQAKLTTRSVLMTGKKDLWRNFAA